MTREVISEDDLKALFSAPPNTKIGRRDQMILILLYDSAIRVSELLSLDVSSVKLDAEIPYLRIYGKDDKERIVAIIDTTAGHIRNYLKGYLKAYHPTRDPDSLLIYTVIKGRKDRMSVGNVERIIKNMHLRFGLNIPLFRNTSIRIWFAGPVQQICIRMELNWSLSPGYLDIPQRKPPAFMRFLQWK